VRQPGKLVLERVSGFKATLFALRKAQRRSLAQKIALQFFCVDGKGRSLSNGLLPHFSSSLIND